MSSPIGGASVTGGLLLDALAGSVDAARYWQEPDGDDLLCGTPEIRASLVHVAEHLADSAAVQAWAATRPASSQAGIQTSPGG